MYGTVARMRARPGAEDELVSTMEDEARNVEGYVGSYVYRLDEDPQTYMLAVLFEDRDTYVRNAEDPAQDREYRRLRELLTEDPEWHDGEVVWPSPSGTMSADSAARAIGGVSAGDDAANRRTLDRLREVGESGDFRRFGDVIREVAADDLIVDWPQSGERIRGVANLLAIDENYSAETGTNPTMAFHGIRGSGGTYVAEGTIDYGDGTPVGWVGVFELRGGKLISQTEYFANPFPAPEWRARWVERM